MSDFPTVENPDAIAHEAEGDDIVHVESVTPLVAVESEDVMVLDEVDDPELVLPMWEPTGEPRVDAALDSMSFLDNSEVSGHATVFTEVHGELRQVLADLDADRL
jgi:hypothetical protein